jgi:hypothetical protein
MYPVKPDAITSFRGEYRFLSNFYLADVEIDGVIYPSAESTLRPSTPSRPRKPSANGGDATSPGRTRLGSPSRLAESWRSARTGSRSNET